MLSSCQYNICSAVLVWLDDDDHNATHDGLDIKDVSVPLRRVAGKWENAEVRMFDEQLPRIDNPSDVCTAQAQLNRELTPTSVGELSGTIDLVIVSGCGYDGTVIHQSSTLSRISDVPPFLDAAFNS